MADERSVDVQEVRDPQPEPEPGRRTPARAAGTRLSPLQEAWGAYVDHATRCAICRSVDAGKCGQAEDLYHAYEEQGVDAFRRLGESR